jgi:hypothetical protein
MKQQLQIVEKAEERGAFAAIEDAIAAVRAGKMVIVVDDLRNCCPPSAYHAVSRTQSQCPVHRNERLGLRLAAPFLVAHRGSPARQHFSSC